MRTQLRCGGRGGGGGEEAEEAEEVKVVEEEEVEEEEVEEENEEDDEDEDEEDEEDEEDDMTTTATTRGRREDDERTTRGRRDVDETSTRRRSGQRRGRGSGATEDGYAPRVPGGKGGEGKDERRGRHRTEEITEMGAHEVQPVQALLHVGISTATLREPRQSYESEPTDRPHIAVPSQCHYTQASQRTINVTASYTAYCARDRGARGVKCHRLTNENPAPRAAHITPARYTTGITRPGVHRGRFVPLLLSSATA